MLISELIYGVVQLYQFIDDDSLIYNPDLINTYDNWKCTTTAALQVWSKLSSVRSYCNKA